MSFMNARKPLLAIVVSLCSLGAGALLAAPAALAGEHCENEASRQGPSASLPQCRAYEQVTPVDKGGALDLFPIEEISGSTDVEPIPVDRGYAAEDGSEFLLSASSSIGATAPTGLASYVFSRGSEGWTMSTVDPPIARPQTVIARVFDPTNLSAIGFSDLIGPSKADLSTANESSVQLASMVGPAAGPYSTLGSVSGFAVEVTRETGINLVGGSEDLSRVILESKNHSLAPEAADQDLRSDALYESVDGAECSPGGSNCKLVNVNEKGETMLCGATLGQRGEQRGGAHDAVSSDGSRIFFTAPDPTSTNGERAEGPGCWNFQALPSENPPEVYMRVNGKTTVEISKPEEGVKVGTTENPALPAVFVGASADGAKAFFVTETELTEDDKWHAPELYEYDAEAPVGKRLVRVSSGDLPSGPAEGNVDFVAAVSSDSSSVYFTAFGALTPGASVLPQGKTRGGAEPVNLYRYDTLTGKTTYITRVNAGDYPESLVGELLPWYHSVFGEGKAEDLGLASDAEWYTTDDGRYLVFGTEKPITGYDNAQAPDVRCDKVYSGVSSGECVELYRYDAEAEEHKEPAIVCVSCAGSAPVDDAVFARSRLETPAGGPPRPISENGEDVFFDTASALVPQVTPGKVHVYEWHDGTISLISSPSDPGDAFFLGSSADGSNVFFSTHAQLVPQDTDVSDDIYDARVDGGFAGLVAPQCTGTGCQGVPAAAPIFATPSSETFAGVGNVPASEAAVKPASKPKSKAKSKPKKCRGDGSRRGEKHGKCVRVEKRARRSARGRK
jgi:hypothetical protein